MTIEQIKEALSRRFVELLANRAGYKCSKPDPDCGVDLSVERVLRQHRYGKIRFLDSGQFIQLQLKATTEASLIASETGFKYDLEAKTYNDLVDRRNAGTLVPLYLVLFVLPNTEANWLTVTPNELTLRRTAFWYWPELGAEPTTNSETKRISIRNTDVVDLNFVPLRFEEIYD